MQFSSALLGWLALVCLSSHVAVSAAQQYPAGQTPPKQTPPAPPASQTPQQERTLGKRITDSWITMKIHSQFIPEDALEDSDIDVETRNGVVTLSGTVASEAGRTRAVELAKATEGVKNVDDKLLRVGKEAVGTAGREAREAAKGTGRRITDGWIKSKIYAQFLTEDTLEDSNIDVDVANSMVTLNGTVRSQPGRTRAAAIAKATDGVKGVKDALKVAPQ